jgi:two-component sensor histidine kinase
MLENNVLAALQPQTRPNPWLFIEEIEHRVMNEYAMAAASISLAAARTAFPDVKATLTDAVRRLRSYADVHRSLQPPAADGLLNLADYLRSLCKSLVRARLSERGISLTLVELDLQISAGRCWRVGLIVSELITNSIRHALSGGRGQIVVETQKVASHIHCSVADNGRSTGNFVPGRGSRIVDALALELGGYVDRQFGPDGATVTLLFPE